MTHLILDFETFGQEATQACPFEVSLLKFDTKVFETYEGYTYKQLEESTVKVKFDVKKFVDELNFTIFKDGLEFWKNKPNSNLIKPNSELDKDPIEALNAISDFINNEKLEHWWSRSNTFDPIILWQIIARTDKKYDSRFNDHFRGILPYWKVRDTRSIIQGMSMFSLKNTNFPPTSNVKIWEKYKHKEHDSSHDIVSDVLRIQYVWRAVTDLPEVDIFRDV